MPVGFKYNPFQGNEVVYLSGTGAGSWIAWTNGPVAGRKCKFIDNVDFDTSSVTGKTTVKQNGPVTSKESCCIACYETVECAASVFNIETSECWLKNQTQLQKKVAHDGRIACIKNIVIIETYFTQLNHRLPADPHSLGINNRSRKVWANRRSLVRNEFFEQLLVD